MEGWRLCTHDSSSYKCYFWGENGCDHTVPRKLVDAVLQNEDKYRSTYGVYLSRYREHCFLTHGKLPYPEKFFELCNKPKSDKDVKTCTYCTPNGDMMASALGVSNFMLSLNNYGMSHNLTHNPDWIRLMERGQDIAAHMNKSAMYRKHGSITIPPDNNGNFIGGNNGMLMGNGGLGGASSMAGAHGSLSLSAVADAAEKLSGSGIGIATHALEGTGYPHMETDSFSSPMHALSALQQALAVPPVEEPQQKRPRIDDSGGLGSGV